MSLSEIEVFFVRKAIQSCNDFALSVVCYKNAEPDFERAKEVHMKTKADQLNEFKQLSTAASLLGIGENVLARVTGSVLINPPDNSVESWRKINIGLQLKSRTPVRSHTFLSQLFCLNEEF